MTTTTTTPEPTCPIPLSELQDDLDGFEEKVIRQHFSATIEQLAQGDEVIMLMRAMVFAHQRRQNVEDSQAYRTAMQMKRRELWTYFADEPDDVDPEQPDSAAGKDD